MTEESGVNPPLAPTVEGKSGVRSQPTPNPDRGGEERRTTGVEGERDDFCQR
ncbi:hypothetical protein [Okeania sp. KiyG1]|uniref:hypothetical protein n=1 Tax=Okeania sp. KiyG1 TaxID=2720165 RepID=UPI00192042C8|nr:hypothetical protein [Okeania sp. KiyG1]